MNDTRTVFAVIAILGAAVGIGMVGVIVLAYTDTPVPTLLDHVVTLAIGAVAALLGNASTKPDPTAALAANAARNEVIAEVAQLGGEAVLTAPKPTPRKR